MQMSCTCTCIDINCIHNKITYYIIIYNKHVLHCKYIDTLSTVASTSCTFTYGEYLKSREKNFNVAYLRYPITVLYKLKCLIINKLQRKELTFCCRVKLISST